MATYKVLQDIEAEDKLIGPLSLRQFIYAGICVVCLYLSYLVIAKGIAFAAAVFLPVALASGFFAWPWSRDQPTEIWALAKIRFLVKSRRRLWDQSGVKELVTITAPKKIDRVYTNGLSETEVKSRLKVLADTIDSRGWAIKNVNVNVYTQGANRLAEQESDRLISLDALPQDVPSVDIQAADDMLDEQNNPLAQQMESQLEAASKAHRERIVEQLHRNVAAPPQPPAPAPRAPAAPQNNYWFLNQPNQPAASVPQNAVTFNTQVVAPTVPAQSRAYAPQPGTYAAAGGQPVLDEAALLRQLHEQENQQNQAYMHLHNIQPLSAQGQPNQAAAAGGMPGQNPVATTQEPPVTQPAKPATLDLARNNDLNVATIAREAHRRQELPPDEVVIALH